MFTTSTPGMTVSPLALAPSPTTAARSLLARVDDLAPAAVVTRKRGYSRARRADRLRANAVESARADKARVDAIVSEYHASYADAYTRYQLRELTEAEFQTEVTFQRNRMAMRVGQ